MGPLSYVPGAHMRRTSWPLFSGRSSIEADGRAVSRIRPPLPRTGIAGESVVAGTRCASGGGCSVVRRGATGWSLPRGLAAQAETLDDRPVPVDVGLGQVVEQPAALADEQQQAAAAVVIVLVRLEVLGEVRDAARQQRDLHLRRAGVALGGAVLGDDLLLDILGERHGRLLRVCRAGALRRSASRWRFRRALREALLERRFRGYPRLPDRRESLGDRVPSVRAWPNSR